MYAYTYTFDNGQLPTEGVVDTQLLQKFRRLHPKCLCLEVNPSKDTSVTKPVLILLANFRIISTVKKE